MTPAIANPRPRCVWFDRLIWDRDMDPKTTARTDPSPNIQSNEHTSEATASPFVFCVGR
jgi:hypothetical protein